MIYLLNVYNLYIIHVLIISIIDRNFFKRKKLLYCDIYWYRDIKVVISWYKILVISPTPIRKYLLSVILIFVNLATICLRACFLKTTASLQFNDLHFNIFSEKCNSSSVQLWERERMREWYCVCMNRRNSEAVALIPLETMMLPAPCWER